MITLNSVIHTLAVKVNYLFALFQRTFTTEDIRGRYSQLLNMDNQGDGGGASFCEQRKSQLIHSFYFMIRMPIPGKFFSPRNACSQDWRGLSKLTVIGPCSANYSRVGKTSCLWKRCPSKLRSSFHPPSRRRISSSMRRTWKTLTVYIY